MSKGYKGHTSEETPEKLRITSKLAHFAKHTFDMWLKKKRLSGILIEIPGERIPIFCQKEIM